ncbi:MAG: CRTAC1 family protein [Cyclobacteriaceae bacterium]|nr:CRTAC1 family protein [Cyclobacteriaceae bacterium]
MIGRLWQIILVFLLIPLFLSGQKTYAQPQVVGFHDVAREAGLDFMYTFGDYTYENILESSGSGITILDYNGDGWMDIYMLNGIWLEGISDPAGKIFANTPNRLYRNNGDGTFTETAAMAGVDDRHWSMAAGAIDYDNDGDTDIYLLNYGPNVFYENNGDGTFTDIADRLGLRGEPELNGFTKWSVGVAFWDFNEDNRLDMMVGNFLAFDPSYKSAATPEMMPHPSEYAGQPSLLYQQMPDGTFKDVTKSIGMYYPQSKCMGLTVFDYEEDGDLDLFQGNDHQENFLFRNDGNGRFTEVARRAGVAVNDKGIPTGSMHGSIGDIDGDGLFDLLVTDLRYGALYRNVGHGVFEDITGRSGVATVFSGKGEWGAILFDFDNDGDLDIFSANGTAEELILQPQLLLENDGLGNFKDVGKDLGKYFSEKRSGRGAAAVDFDNDGDMDVVVSHIDLKASASLLRNDNRTENHWLGISLEGKNGPLSAIGAKVIVHQAGKKIVRLNQPGNTYLSYNDPRIHFGLGKTGHIDLLEVLWLDGTHDRIQKVKPDRYITIVQGNGIKD